MFETLPCPLPLGERKFGFFSFEFVSDWVLGASDLF
jgi:hypothetical protein